MSRLPPRGVDRKVDSVEFTFLQLIWYPVALQTIAKLSPSLTVSILGGTNVNTGNDLLIRSVDEREQT